VNNPGLGGINVLGWKKDKSKEFSLLADPLMNQLYGTALKLTRDEENAKDLIQDTYLKAFKYFESFQTGTNFKAWIFRIMTRLFYDQYRAKKRANALFVPLEYTKDVTYKNSENSGEQRMLAKELEKALESMPSDFSLPVILSDIQGFSYQEISEMIDCPIGTVMSRLYRGRRRLKTILLNQENVNSNKSRNSGVVIPL
jgi:RNA polymerase sigma-70 factor, ECF subfamily